MKVSCRTLESSPQLQAEELRELLSRDPRLLKEDRGTDATVGAVLPSVRNGQGDEVEIERV
jgi:hypothetical protein